MSNTFHAERPDEILREWAAPYRGTNPDVWLSFDDLANSVEVLREKAEIYAQIEEDLRDLRTTIFGEGSAASFSTVIEVAGERLVESIERITELRKIEESTEGLRDEIDEVKQMLGLGVGDAIKDRIEQLRNMVCKTADLLLGVSL